MTFQSFLQKYWGILAGCALLVSVVFVGACAGNLDPDNWVKVDVPHSVRDPGQPARLSVNEARADFSLKAQKYGIAMDLYAANIMGGADQAAAFRSLFSVLSDNLNIAGAAIPGWTVFGGGAISTSLTGALGFRKPGDVSSKDAQTNADTLYDEGLRVGKTFALDGTAAANALALSLGRPFVVPPALPPV